MSGGFKYHCSQPLPRQPGRPHFSTLLLCVAATERKVVAGRKYECLKAEGAEGNGERSLQTSTLIKKGLDPGQIRTVYTSYGPARSWRTSTTLLYSTLHPHRPLQHRPQLPCPEPHVGIGPEESRVDYIRDMPFDLLIISDPDGHGDAVPAPVP